jgi:drug/metabolite transporter (DMT)-like permease
MFWIIPALVTAFSEATKDYFSKRAMKNINYYLASWSLLALALPFFLFSLAFVGIPEIGPNFWTAIVANSVLYTVSIALYMKAISKSPLSLTLPMLSFTPAFMLLTGPLILGEFPKGSGILGIASIVIGAYVLNIKDVKKGLLSPFVSLAKERGPMYMLGVSLLWSITATLMKFSVNESSPVFAAVSLYLISAIIFSVFVFATKKVKVKEIKTNFKSLISVGFFVSVSEISLAYAFTLTLAVYAIAVKRLSILIGSFYGFKFFKEGEVAQRIAGSALMLLGIALIAF